MSKNERLKIDWRDVDGWMELKHCENYEVNPNTGCLDDMKEVFL